MTYYKSVKTRKERDFIQSYLAQIMQYYEELFKCFLQISIFHLIFFLNKKHLFASTMISSSFAHSGSSSDDTLAETTVTI